MQTSSSNRRILISCIVIFVIVCICLSLASILGAGIMIFTQNRTNSVNTEPSSSEAQPDEEDIDQQLNEIENQISQLRGLEPMTEIDPNFLTPDALRQHVLDDFLEEYTPQEAQIDAQVLWAFGLLDKNFDLYNFYVDLYSEQIAGFYDQEVQEMYVVQDGDFAGPERLTYAHEFVHSLQDQYYDIEDGLDFNDEACETDSERCAAISALLEGDASLTEALWFSSYASTADQREIAEFYNAFQSPVYDTAPTFIQQDFIFPYQQGQMFVESLYDQGGWELIDEAYMNPPVSTEQILHPENYPDDIPETVSLPDLNSFLDQGWVELDRGVMGEWYSYLILAYGDDASSRLSSSQASKATAGWAGDSYVVLYNESLDQMIMMLLTRWENNNEALEFKTAFEQYANNRFGESTASGNDSLFWESMDGVHSINTEGRSTAWIFAPDRETTETLLPMLDFP